MQSSAVSHADSRRSLLWRQGEAVCEAFQHLGVGVAQLDLDGKWLAVNTRLCEIADLSRNELLATSFQDVFCPPDSQADADLCHHLLSGDIPSYSIEKRTKHKNGTVVWVRTAFSLVRDAANQKPVCFFMVVEDVTAQQNAELAARELSGRLINAVEAERSRIARELHDDIGQSLAILVFQIMRAGKPISDDPTRSHPGLPVLCEKVQAIASRVSHLSHQLHSSKLEYMGLVRAMTGTCREFTDEHKIKVDCSCENIPEQLDSAIGLCCLRVVQEALSNIAKHSHAHHVRVKLTGSETKIDLSVSDDGVGFDVEKAKLAQGIGLISMRERVRMIGGELTITSLSGQGSSLEARIPIAGLDPRSLEKSA